MEASIGSYSNKEYNKGGTYEPNGERQAGYYLWGKGLGDRVWKATGYDAQDGILCYIRWHLVHRR